MILSFTTYIASDKVGYCVATLYAKYLFRSGIGYRSIRLCVILLCVDLRRYFSFNALSSHALLSSVWAIDREELAYHGDLLINSLCERSHLTPSSDAPLRRLPPLLPRPRLPLSSTIFLSISMWLTSWRREGPTGTTTSLVQRLK